MRAIETLYNGRRFRSRLEARWAVCFDRTWMRWEYEHEGIMLPTGPYLPDFRLTTDDGSVLWVEIKPRGEVPERTFSLLRDLADESGEHCFLIAGNPRPCEFEWWHFTPHGERHHNRSTHRYPYLPELMLEATDVPWDNIREAMRAAMRARFEYGETPRTDGLKTASEVLADLRRGSRIGRALRTGDTLLKAEPRVEGEETA